MEYTEQQKQIYNDVCEKYKHNWLNTTISQTMAMEMISKALTIHSVVSSFFTADSVGKSFEIITNSTGHGFEIGETVSLMELNPDPDDDQHKFAGKDDYWWCGFADVKKL